MRQQAAVGISPRGIRTRRCPESFWATIMRSDKEGPNMSKVLANDDAPCESSGCKPTETRRIWEIEGRMQCPVIGACLTVSEHRILLKKVGVQSRRLSPYVMHRTLMEHLHERNPLSVKVDAYLRHKYRQRVPGLLALDPEAFMALWRESFRQGDMEAAFYAAAIRGDLSSECMGEVFGETHMLCHANLDEVMKARQKVTFHERTNRQLVRSLDNARREVRETRRKNKDLQQSREVAARGRQARKHHDSEAVCSPSPSLETLIAENLFLRQRLAEGERRNQEMETRHRRAEQERERMEKESAEMDALNRSLSEEVSSLIAQLGEASRRMASCKEHCPRSSLCARRVLIVGGLTKMKDLYRRLVESHGGRFEYHDGYMKQGKQELDAQVRRADMILCPVSCNSHAACLMVKKLSAKYGKTVKMVPSSGLSYLSRELLQEAENPN